MATDIKRKRKRRGDAVCRSVVEPEGKGLDVTAVEGRIG